MAYLHQGIITSPKIPDDPLECVLHLRNNITCLTTEGGSEPEYKLARTALMEIPEAKRLMPNYVRYSPDAASLRTSLSAVASGPGSWSLRRAHVAESFEPMIRFLEAGGCAADHEITAALATYDAPAVQAAWTKALERRSTDPEGAVTAARTLLEEVCKHIIEDSGGTCEKKWNTPKLYGEASLLLHSIRRTCSRAFLAVVRT